MLKVLHVHQLHKGIYVWTAEVGGGLHSIKSVFKMRLLRKC